MTMITAARTQDTPMSIDNAADVLLTVPAGTLVELKEGPNGTTLVVRRATTDAIGQSSIAAERAANDARMRAMAAAARGPK